MQTFLPYADFEKSAAVLDRQRLGKQRVETLQIMKALRYNKGWVNHPATKMWRGHEGFLITYQRAVVGEWLSRGYKDTCWEKTLDAFHFTFGELELESYRPPPWLGDEALHLSHRSNLLRKLPAHYGPLFEPGLRDDLPYVWPV